MNLGGLFTTIGETGNQFANAKLLAYNERMQKLFDQLGIKREQTEEAQREENLRKSKLTEEAKIQEQIAAAQKIAKAHGFTLSPEDIRSILSLPAAQQPQKITNEFEAWREAFKTRTGNYPTDAEIEAHHKAEQRAGGTKPTKNNTYDPSGHLRTAFVDPNTGEVVAWGPLVPEREAFHYITDTEGNVHAVRMPTTRTVTPGEIRQTEKAAAQWAQIAPPEHKPLPKTMVKGGTAGTAAAKSDIIGQTAPKYTPPLANALKSAQSGYKNWLSAMENSHFHTPKADLAIVFSAVRSQVEGAGRMTNAELDREMKAGSYGDRFKRWYDGAVSGTLPDDQRQDLINVIRDSWLAAAETARAAWQSDMPNKEMPIYIKADDLDDLAVKVKH